LALLFLTPSFADVVRRSCRNDAPMFLAAAANDLTRTGLCARTGYPPEAKAIILFLVIFSIIAWTLWSESGANAAGQELNRFFNTEFHTQKNSAGMFRPPRSSRRCPCLWSTSRSVELDARLKNADGSGRKKIRVAQGHGTCETFPGKTPLPGIVETRIRIDPSGYRCGGGRFLAFGHGLGVMSTFGQHCPIGSATMLRWLLAWLGRL